MDMDKICKPDFLLPQRGKKLSSLRKRRSDLFAHIKEVGNQVVNLDDRRTWMRMLETGGSAKWTVYHDTFPGILSVYL
jgi:hypothetical protein